MSDDVRDYLSSSTSARYSIEEEATSTKGSSRSPADSVADVSIVHKIYYPCFGKVDIKSYIDARLYGFSFQRMHDEWVVLGKPRIDTSHWPRMAGHRGLPTSPEDFLRVAEYYDTKIYEQVLLEAQGKPADRDRPLEDYFGSMVTTAAIAKADLGAYRLLQDLPSAGEAAAQKMWYQTFTMLLQESIRYFISERTVCDRLGPHNCVGTLLFGQAYSMATPTLLENLTFQMQILRNVFPNFGDHFIRCAAARAPQQWSPTLAVTSPFNHSTPAAASQDAVGHGKPRASGMHSSSSDEASSETMHRASSNATTQSDAMQQLLPDLSRPLTSIFIPAELKGRRDLFAAAVNPAIRCDVPLEKVVSYIDSRRLSSASTSTSSASTPASITIKAPIHSAQTMSGVSSGASVPSSDTDWHTRRRTGVRTMSNDNVALDIESTNLTLRHPLQSHASWSEGAPGQSPSEDGTMITPEEIMTLHSRRAQGSSAHSYFSSLPTTPTEMFSPSSLSSSQEGSQPFLARRLLGSGTGPLSMTSASDSDSRKRARVEQNREKMKAYHRRVMQQREALTSVLADVTSNVGSIPVSASRLGASPLTSPTSTRVSEEPAGEATSSSIGRSSQEPSWSAAVRNKQKQESKARLRKREIDHVHELGMYARYATATLVRSFGPDATDPTRAVSAQSRIAGPSRAGADQISPATTWRQLDSQHVSEADLHMSHAIVRVFLRHRSNWIALISAEQRLAVEVSKLSSNTESSSGSGGGGSDEPGSSRSIKELLDWIQSEEQAGRMVIPGADATPMALEISTYEHVHSRASMSAPASMMSLAGAVTSRVAAGSPASQHFERPAGYNPSNYLQTGATLLSPSSSDYGAKVSPSGVTGLLGADEGGDYFDQDRKRYHGRNSDTSEIEASTQLIPVPTGYGGAEQANSPLVSRMPVAGMLYSPGSETVLPLPSVLQPSGGYGYNAAYQQEAGQQARMAPQAFGRPLLATMNATSVGEPLSSMGKPQSRVPMHYDSRSYSASVMQGASETRMAQGPSMYHSQPLQSPSFAYPAPLTAQTGAQLELEAQHAHSLQGVGGVPSMTLHQYRSNQAPALQYPPNQPNPYGQQGPYSGGQ